MQGGYMNRILRVDLSNRTWTTEELDEKLVRDYIGGRGFGAKFLYDDLKPGIDPLGEENEIIFIAGPLAATGAQSCARFEIYFKSPQTGGYFQSSGGGFFAPEMKFAGYDAIIIKGKSEKPVYLWIHDDKVEFKDASYLWGLGLADTEQLIREELNDPYVRVAAIGPAGENLVKYAGVFSDRRAAARGGGGAVMGSKNLKGVAVRGHQKVPIANNEAFQQALKAQVGAYKGNPMYEMMHTTGTQASELTAVLGMYPWKNFREAPGPEWEKLQASEFNKLRVRKMGCQNCMIRCSQITKVWDGPYKGVWSEGPEYETLWSFSGPIGKAEIGLTVLADRLCDDLGMDTISAGQSIGFAYELYEKGIITKEDTDGLELVYGNIEPVPRLIEMIARREGFGNVLAEGTKRMAEKYNQGSEYYAIQVKGLELPAYDPRGAKAHGLNLATSPLGADHNYGYGSQELFGVPIPHPVDRFAVEGKGEITKFNQDWAAFTETGILCTFASLMTGPDIFSQLLYGATGVEEFADPNYMWVVGERIVNLERMFNAREGFTREEDRMPERIVKDPLPYGPSAGQVFEQDELLDQYYEARGWDKVTGIPKAEKLRELGLDFTLDYAAQ